MKVHGHRSPSRTGPAAPLLCCGLAALVLVFGTAPAVQAQGFIPYNDGTDDVYNPITYTFTAATTGDITAYFAGSGAAYDNQLGLLVNGTLQGGFGLDDHTSFIGQSYNFGSVTAGSTLVFVLDNITLGEYAYSDPSLNLAYDDGPATGTTDGHNHIYSTDYTGLNPGYGTPPLSRPAYRTGYTWHLKICRSLTPTTTITTKPTSSRTSPWERCLNRRP